MTATASHPSQLFCSRVATWISVNTNELTVIDGMNATSVCEKRRCSGKNARIPATTSAARWSSSR